MDPGRVTNSFVFLLALGVVASGATSSKPSAQAGADARRSASAGSYEGQPLPPSMGYQTILERYLGPDVEEKALCDSRIKGKTNIVHALIATLPDPSDPHLADVFDNYLGSLQLALANDGYLADQYWLPEMMRRKEQAKNNVFLPDLAQSVSVIVAGKRAPASTVTSIPAKRKSDFLDEPGILLFRRQPKEQTPDELLFLFLVPETPTGGVRQSALKAALDRAASPPCQQETAVNNTTIRIIGPSFSGAAASLARGIHRWQHTSKVQIDSSHIEIISGSATNINTRELLKQVAQFSATVTPDQVMCDFYEYLVEKLNPKRGVIAIFTESNTSYGQTAPSLSRGGRFGNRKDQIRDVLPSPCDDPGSGYKAKARILDLYFPLHVSQLGAEYEKSRAQKQVAVLPEGDARLLSLNLAEQEEPGDVAPAMSALTKYSADLSLVNSLMAIDRAHLNVVGIRATDPRDELFLAGKIKQIVPDVQLFLMDSDLLFSHTSLAKEMRGALVVSRYPLFNLNQLWTPPRQASPRVQFVSGSSQGVYNAAILQLRKFDKERLGKPASAELERTDPTATPVTTTLKPFIDNQQNPEGEEARRVLDELPKPLEYGEPFEPQSSRPPLWVGMVGHYGIWPVGTLGEDKSGSLKEYVKTSSVKWEDVKGYTAEFPSVDPPMPLIYPLGVLHTLATLLMLVALSWHALAHGLPGSSNTPSGRHPLLCSPPANISSTSRSALSYAAVQILGWQSLIAIYLVAAAPIVAPRVAAFLHSGGHPKSTEWYFWPVLIGGPLSAVVWFALGILIYVRVVRTSRGTAWTKLPGFEKLTLFFCGVTGAALLALAAAFFVKLAFFSPTATKVFLWVRAANWLSGISPMLPLVFFGAAVYATTWLNLYRLSIASKHEDKHVREYTAPLGDLLPEPGSLKTREDNPSLETPKDSPPKTSEANPPETSEANPPKAAEANPLEAAESAANDVALGGVLVTWRGILLLTLPVVAMVVFFNLRPGAEPGLWTWLMRVLLGLLILGIVHGLALLVQLWRTTSKTLHHLAGHPVLDVLRSMRRELGAMVGLHSYAAAPHQDQVLACERVQLNALKYWAAHQPEDQPVPEKLQKDSKLRDGVDWASKELAKKAWPCGKDEPDWFRSAARLVALEVVRTLARRISVIRALIGILTIDAFVLLMVTQIYPFQPQSMLSGLSWFLLLAVVIASAWALVTMERDAVLSYASGSEPGKVTWDASFVLHLALFVVLPLAALVAARFPEIGGPIFESLQPLVRSAR